MLSTCGLVPKLGEPEHEEVGIGVRRRFSDAARWRGLRGRRLGPHAETFAPVRAAPFLHCTALRMGMLHGGAAGYGVVTGTLFFLVPLRHEIPCPGFVLPMTATVAAVA